MYYYLHLLLNYLINFHQKLVKERKLLFSSKNVTQKEQLIFHMHGDCRGNYCLLGSLSSVCGVYTFSVHVALALIDQEVTHISRKSIKKTSIYASLV